MGRDDNGQMRIQKSGYRAAFAALATLLLLIPAAHFVYHTRAKTFSLTYFPDNLYPPAGALPTADEHGGPRVVLVRRAGQVECFDVYYSQKLKQLLEATAAGRIQIVYRVSYRFGRPFWIETMDVGGLGIEPVTSRYTVKGTYRTGKVSPGECF
jgi:hypothetical protein